jgi:outer membrane cobalamin receptor
MNRNSLKYALLILALYGTLSLNGQMSFPDDTVKINEVIINGKISSDIHSGFKKTTLDSSIMRNYNQRTIAEILSENTGVFIKSYGMGGTATPSFRGTGASHTQITWNGISIDHPMLGQSDLSLLPAGLIDDIQLYFGGASMVLNSGGIGGSINLETRPVWNNETFVSLNPGIGSFGRYSALVAVKSGNDNFQTISKAFFQSCDNNFRYLNNELSAIPVWKTRTNSQMRQQGYMQELYYRKSVYTLSARFWYQSAHRNLPSSLLTQPSETGETQYDQSVRTIINLDIDKEKNKYFVTGAWIMNRLDYNNRLASIASRNLSDLFTAKAGYTSLPGSNFKFNFILKEELNIIKSNNYEHKPVRNTSSISSAAEYNGSGRLGASILVREIFDRNKLLIPDISAGVQLKLTGSEEYYLKANVSRNSKIPTMNDMYWLPGGNPNLKNEYAYIYELSYQMIHQISVPLSVDYDISAFKNSIHDMIQWHPGEFSYWTADNIQSVNTTGIESSLSLKYKINHISSTLKGGYSFTRAIDMSLKENQGALTGKQLIYIPENQANASFRFSFNNIYALWNTNITGKRYTTVDNTNYLPAYMLNSVTTGIKFKIKKNSLDLNFNVDNLFNVNYQTIAFYPLPGRSYFLNLSIQFYN